MKRAIGYARVSTAEQANEGISLDAQQAAIAAYCAARGLELTEVIVDRGVSATKTLSKREGGRRVLSAAHDGGVVAIVAMKLDRLFRNARDCLDVTARWDKAGVALHVLDMGGQAIDTSSALGKFFLHMLAGVAEMERNLIAERIVSALDHKKVKGEKTGGDVPYGFKLAADGATLVKDRREQAALRKVRRLREDGLSLRTIVDRLNAERVPARGERWHLTTVARLLKTSG